MRRVSMRPLAWVALLSLVLGLAAGAHAQAPAAASDAEAAMRADSRRYIVLAVDNRLQAVPRRAGSSLPAYAAPKPYGIGAQAAAALSALQREHGLIEVAGWPIGALGVHCVVYRLPPEADRDTLLLRLASDARVRLAQPLQDFSPQTREAPAAAAGVEAARYNDPYVGLQRGFADTAAARAHRSSTGRDVEIAIVDTGVDSHHPDLAGRIAGHRDLVGGAQPLEADRHGTEVAGVIAATANNGLGIVGIAPQARLRLYRACWYAAPGGAARCNSFTLAKALAAVLDGPAQVLNLSLGGPADPLLEALLQKILQQGRIVVAALPASGRREGFPAGQAGVLVAGIAGTPLPPGVLPAPGRDVLTLVPGGRYDYASGSSLAAAHATGVAALLLAADPGLDTDRLHRLLAAEAGALSINAAQALLRLDRDTPRARSQPPH
jgi:subtilisin family serine protease